MSLLRSVRTNRSSEGGSFPQQQDDHDDGNDDGNDDEDVGADFPEEEIRRAMNASRQPGRAGGPSTGEYPRMYLSSVNSWRKMFLT